METIGIVQARTGSKRLKNKTVTRVGKKMILEILLERLTASETIEEIVVATTTSPADDIIERTVADLKALIFRGSEKDVLDRYYRAAKEHQGKTIVRITSDNPFTDVYLLDAQVRYLRGNSCDYVTSETLLGLGSEVMSYRALEESWRHATEPYQRENVTPYVYENPGKFKISYLEPPPYAKQEGVRLTIDYPEDLLLYEALEDHFGDLVRVDVSQVIDFLNENPRIRKINDGVRQKNYLEYEA